MEMVEPIEGNQSEKLVQITDSSDLSEANHSELRLLREHKLQYEAYIAQGGFDFINTKVLHAVENPYAACLKKKSTAKHQAPSPALSNSTHPSPPNTTLPFPPNTTHPSPPNTTHPSPPNSTHPSLPNSTHQSPPSLPNSTQPPSTDQLVEEIETLKKRIRRMNELFTAQTNRFRDAVYQLTGWHVEMSTHENKLRIRSRYSRSDDEYLELLW